MSLAALLAGDTATVSPYEGESAYGPSYGAQVSGPCRAEYRRKLVRSDSGDEVISETTLYVPVRWGATDTVPLFPPESVVTVNGKGEARVITAQPHRGLGPPLYVEVTLT